MSSHDTMRIAEAERQKANDLEKQADHVLQTAQQQADGMRSQAHTHQNEAARLDQKAQQEEQQEAKEAAEAEQKEEEKRERIKNMAIQAATRRE